MGARDDMLRKYLRIAGFGAILFGILFFVISIASMMGALNDPRYVIEASFWQKFLYLAQAAQGYGLQTFESMTLGGICLYLARRLSEEKND